MPYADKETKRRYCQRHYLANRSAVIAKNTAYAKAHPEKRKEINTRYLKRVGYRERLFALRRASALRAGQVFTILFDQIEWPRTCPVLGMELMYEWGFGTKRGHKPNSPSLDRRDNSKGYIPGNVYVISMRANTLKRDATLAEVEAIAAYMRD